VGRRARVFFVRPHRELLEQDGVRDMMDWESVVRIDGAIMMALAMLDIPYVPIESLAMADRLRVIMAVVR
jgi:predicted ATPase